MAKLSKFVKVDKNVLLEYIYDDDNNIGESYDVLVNSKEKRQSYLATPSSGTNNTQNNSLFLLDKVSNKFGKIDTSQYSFLQIRNFSSSAPIRHDRVVVHLPINWTFGEYLGFYVRIYTYDVLNQVTYDLSNYYFDMTDASQGYLLNFTSPPLLFSEKLWGKNLTIDFPAVSAVSAQRVNNRPKVNSINANLTNGSGISLTTPVFIDFHFINNIQTINGVSTYLLNPKVSVSVPQTPEFENLGLKIEHSTNGDFFEIYGTYNGTIGGFKQFIDDSFIAGARYYVQYNITTFEQNVRGKTITTEVTDNFNETIEYRPIIKTSTTTAMIDVEMKLIDASNESTIVRRATYGMLQDEVSRYSLNLIKINLKNANKPKIYNTKLNRPVETKAIEDRIFNIKNKSRGLPPVKDKLPNMGVISVQQDPKLTGLVSNAVNQYLSSSNIATDSNMIKKITDEILKNLSGGQSLPGSSTIPQTELQIQTYQMNDIVASIDGSQDGAQPQGQLPIIIEMMPETIAAFKFRISQKNNAGSTTDPFKLNVFDEIQMIFGDETSVEKISNTSGGVVNKAGGVATSDLEKGLVYFEIDDNNKQSIRKFYQSGRTNFLIVGLKNGKPSTLYRGVYDLSDSKNMQRANEILVAELQAKQKEMQLAKLGGVPSPKTTQDPTVNAPTGTNNSTATGNAESVGNAPPKKGG